MKKTKYMILAILLWFSTTYSGLTQTESCNAYRVWKEAFEQSFKAHVAATGMSKTGAVIEVWDSGIDSQFVVLYVYPTGQACVIDGGTEWQNLLATPPPGDPA